MTIHNFESANITRRTGEGENDVSISFRSNRFSLLERAGILVRAKELTKDLSPVELSRMMLFRNIYAKDNFPINMFTITQRLKRL